MIITLFSSNEPRIIRSSVSNLKICFTWRSFFFAYISGLAFPHFFQIDFQLTDMKFLALFVTLLVVLALVSAQKSQNTNHNVIVIGAKKPGAAPAAPPAAAPAAAPAAPEAGLADAPAES